MSRRPVFLNLLQLKFPITAMVSITHRVTGVLLFLFLPFVLWYWHLSLVSLEGFTKVQSCMHQLSSKITLFIFLASLVFHIIAGLRHMVMDVGAGESLRSATITAVLAFVVFGISVVYLGYLLW